MKIVKEIFAGSRELPGQGPHPGTDIMIVVAIAAGLIGGVVDGGAGFIVWSVLSLVLSTPAWIVVAVQRARAQIARNNK